MTIVAGFVEQLRRDGFPEAKEIESALSEIDLAGDVIPDAAAFYEGCMWILQQDKTAGQKLDAISKLSCIGKAEGLSMREFTGWH